MNPLRAALARRRTRAGFDAATHWPEVLVRPGAVPEPLPAAAGRPDTHEVVGAVSDPAPLWRALTAVPDAAVVTCDAVIRGLPVLRPCGSPERDAVIDPTAGGCLVRRDLAGDPWAAAVAHGRVHVPLPLGRAIDDPAVRPVARPAVTGDPTVEIIVPFRDRPELLKRLLPSLRDAKRDGVKVTLVDNGSTDPAVAEVTRDWEVRADPRPFNFSALNNAAAGASSADVLVFLNSDTEILDDAWLDVLVSYALQPDIGAVGPLLVTGEGRVQHAGVAVGIHGTAGHPFAGLRPGTPTAFGSADDGPRNWLAVTAACLAVERAKFVAGGGFDEGFAIAGQDVDLGLRLHAQGLRNLVIPAVQVLHDESLTRGEDEDLGPDVRYSRERYEPYLSGGDPYYHPALTLERTDCSFRD